MRPKFFLTVFSTAVMLLTPTAAFAESVLEKVARTEVLSVGIRLNAVPYSYVDDQDNLVGYSIDVLDLIEARIEAELNKDIVVQQVEANDPAQRIPLLRSGQIDLACDTQFTWERDRYVDFSISYGLSGIHVLTLADSDLGTPESLANRKVAVIENSVGDDVMKLVQPGATLVPVASIEAAFSALDAQEVDAIAGERIVLAGVAAQRGAGAYRMAPGDAFERYGVTCMVPENNSAFLNMVNYAIADMVQGYLSGDQDSVSLIERWFGADGVVPLPEARIREFFEMVLIQRAQVPPLPAGPTSNR
jgi:polar amino acid transport system substrate-binding protein